MDTTFVQYPGYTVEIPDRFIHPFKMLSTVLLGANFDHPCELLDFPASEELIEMCDQCVYTAIGKEFAHDGKIADAFNQWRHLSMYERVSEIVKAAQKIEPLDITHMKNTGGRHNFS